MGNMPEDCNGISQIDEDLEFCKMNCKWSRKAQGRPKIDRKAPRPKSKRNTIKHPQSICLVMEKDHLDFIKNQELQRSVQEGHLIEANELIREALQKAFPAPKQFDMFGARK